MNWITKLSFIVAVGILVGCGPKLPEEVKLAQAQLPSTLDYNLHVKPILSDKCFACHGPDKANQKAGLYLHEASGASEVLESGLRAVVAGNLNKSEAFHRIFSEDEEQIMPPPESNLKLTAYEKAVITRWIEEGAEYKPHWAFIKPTKVELPKVSQPDWGKNEIDRFILAKLDIEGIAPSPQADKETLIRRLYFDITGLPPTETEIDAFLSDNSEDAYEKLVDRLLQTDEHAERLAMEWLDVARFADSHGYQSDGLREMWPWRDWVIQAFKDNQSYKEFTTWQLAGDLLPNPTHEQVLATAFLRNNPISAEGGIIAEEYRLKYVFDKTNTVSTAFMGLTMECAQCHDHKYDPLSQENYFELASFFNNTKEIGMISNDRNVGPYVYIFEDSAQQEYEQLQATVADKAKALTVSERDQAKIQDFLSGLTEDQVKAPKPWKTVNFERLGSEKKNKQRVDNKEKVLAFNQPDIVEGKFGKAIQLNVNGDFQYVEVVPNGTDPEIDIHQPFSVTAWINPQDSGKIQMLGGNTGTKESIWKGWEFFIDTLNRPALLLIHEYTDDYIHVVADASVTSGTWTHIGFSYDGTARADQISFFVDGKKVPTKTLYDNLSGSIRPHGYRKKASDRMPIRIGRAYRSFTGENGIFVGSIDDWRLYDQVLSPLETAKIAGNDQALQALLANPGASAQSHALKYAASEYQQARQAYGNAKLDLALLLKNAFGVMVMKEMEQPRQMYIYARGEYDAPTDKVYPGTPESVLAFTDEYPKNRLGLAQWLFAAENPLTARVAVNRYWQMLFGNGLVKTPHDFGSQGSLPTHPALLDWLAVDFEENGWDIRRLLKQMLMSATYQQASDYREELQEVDAENLLLARAPSFRLQAEVIRDNALASAGLLHKQIGGESVKPYQPAGLWGEKGMFSYFLKKYIPSEGKDLYRRSMYTFVKRTSPAPTMQAFDAPSREYCVVRREQTNTPLQALVLMNDPQFIEAARVLAEKVQSSEDLNEQLTQVFRRLTGKHPSEQELGFMKELFEGEREKFASDQTIAQNYLEIGVSRIDEELDPVHTAALASVANTLMNHDAFYMKR